MSKAGENAPIANESLDSATPVTLELESDTPYAEPGSYYDQTPIVPERAPPRDRSKDRHPVVDPSIHNAHAIGLIAPELLDYNDDAEFSTLRPIVEQIRDQARKLRQGDMSSIEEALLGQAMTLGVLFTRAVEWTFSSPSRDTLQARLPLALQVQNNARKTLETLVNIRNGGRPIVLKQQNIAGFQQVNNGLATKSELTEDPANELLGAPKDERLDIRTPRPPSANDSPVEAVDPGRSENARRQGDQPPKRLEARGEIRNCARTRKRAG